MKIRNGFVSNSSSSSFIVAFDEVPHNPEELKKMLFGDEDLYHSPFGDNSWDTRIIAEKVFRDMIKSKIPSIDNIAYTYHVSLYDDPRFENNDGSIDFDKLQKEEEKESKKMAEKFIEENRGNVIYIFKYGDDSGDMEGDMEHGNLFKNLNHVRINNH